MHADFACTSATASRSHRLSCPKQRHVSYRRVQASESPGSCVQPPSAAVREPLVHPNGSRSKVPAWVDLFDADVRNSRRAGMWHFGFLMHGSLFMCSDGHTLVWYETINRGDNSVKFILCTNVELGIDSVYKPGIGHQLRKNELPKPRTEAALLRIVDFVYACDFLTQAYASDVFRCQLPFHLAA